MLVGVFLNFGQSHASFFPVLPVFKLSSSDPVLSLVLYLTHKHEIDVWTSHSHKESKEGGIHHCNQLLLGNLSAHGSLCPYCICHMHYSISHIHWEFKRGITVFLNCLHTFSESMAHFLKTLNTNTRTITQTQNSTNRLQKQHSFKTMFCLLKMKFCLQVTHTHTHTIKWTDISKEQLNTHVLNGKHYDEQKTLIILSVGLLHFQCYTTCCTHSSLL